MQPDLTVPLSFDRFYNAFDALVAILRETQSNLIKSQPSLQAVHSAVFVLSQGSSHFSMYSHGAPRIASSQVKTIVG